MERFRVAGPLTYMKLTPGASDKYPCRTDGDAAERDYPL
jgi:hypothetical protein